MSAAGRTGRRLENSGCPQSAAGSPRASSGKAAALNLCRRACMRPRRRGAADVDIEKNPCLIRHADLSSAANEADALVATSINSGEQYYI